MEKEMDSAILMNNEALLEQLNIKNSALERELKIEAALEKVRARTMAMHRSDELSETVYILFQQFKELGESPDQATIGIINEEEWVIEYWVTMYGSQMNKVFKFSIDEPNVTRRIYQAWKENKKSLVIDLSGQELHDFTAYRASMGGAAANPTEERRFINVALFSNGLINVQSTESRSAESLRLLERFAAVFGQSYTRFLDLKNAEAQARESQIQLALEKVRARTMAMQHSDDLKSAATLLFQQVKALGAPAYSCGYNIWENDDKEFTSWMSTQDGSDINPALKIPLTEDANFIRFNESRKHGEEFYVLELRGERMQEHYRYLKSMPVFKEYFELAEKAGFSQPETQIHHLANFSHGNLLFITLEPCPEFHDVFKRFAAVFDQTYTRFLDLQRAEALARESQIQLALERVRARTMAMQKSSELAETSHVLAQQVRALGIRALGCAFNIMDEDQKASTEWFSNEEGYLPTYKTPKDGIFSHYHAQKDKSLYVKEISGEEFVEHYRYLSTLPGVGDIVMQMTDSGVPFHKSQVDHVAYFKYGYLLFITYEPVPEAHDIFIRFAKVFEQTYTRFLDLKKSEAQARESQVQLAMERVRARTMAMQRSDELKDAALLLFQQVELLGIPAFACGFNIWDEDKQFATAWMAREKNNAIQSPFKTSSTTDIFLEIYEAAQRGESLFVKEQAGEELKVHYEYMSTIPIFREMAAKMAEAGLSFPSIQFMHCAFFPQGYLMFISHEPCPVAWDIFKRFGKVFDLTYTRFNDLKQAEAQARESQIQLALERVRARTMAMQKSGELKDIIQVVYDQFVYLNMSIEHTGFIIDYKEKDDMHIWLADRHEVPTQVIIPYFDTPHWNSFNEAREKGRNFFSNHLDFEEKNRFYKDLFALIPGVNEETKDYYFSCPALAISTVLLENVGLYIENFSGTPYTEEENDTLMRFGRVFQQTYTRFLDLQKAEALAREAVQRASVDRIRGEIASMRTTTDLEKITPLIWNELTTIGVPFIRCGVFIMDEEQQQVNTFLSTPEGNGVAASFHLPYNANPETAQIVAHWNRKEMYKPHWDEAAFADFTKVLAERGAITTGEKFLVESRPTDLYLHFIPFLQGMLYVGDTAPLSDEHLQLVQALAEAFSTAYSRYEDFNKLESAKKQIEKTLVDLKQAQSQLVQAEKMASLGELTAGIAHEIQNPLNFVNNFSEVNQELIAEMREELTKGNIEEVAEMAKQIGDNEGKILHHGKRADAIVKGMLQHSRTSTSTKEPTDINALADEYFRLAYHGMRAKDKSFNAAMPTCYDSSIGRIPLIPQDMGRVLLNLYNNAFYAVHEKKKGSDKEYEPTVSVSTHKKDGKVEISVKDNGNGIPQKVRDKIFQPFFTTKPTGQGTGLGLSLSYDVVKAHSGEIKVESREGEFTEFTISLNL